MTLLQNLVASAAGRRPDALAVTLGEESLTYAELELVSSRIANVLRSAGCAPGDRVVLFAPKGVQAVAAMLGVLKAGGIYVPIDVTSPALRVARIVATCEPAAVLVAGARAARLFLDARVESISRNSPRVVQLTDSEPGMNGLNPGFRFADIELAAEECPSWGSDDLAAAQILFTSGSTGAPKGVVVTHRSVVSFVQWTIEHFGLSPQDRTSGHSPFHFDLSTFDIYGTLAAGGQLHLVPAEATLLPHRLAGFIRDRELTQWFSVPAALSFMAGRDVLNAGDFPHLRRVLWCGEVLPTPTLIYWMERLPHASFTNLYGPTETAIASSYFTVSESPADPREPTPIGTACRGERLRVLDGNLSPVPPETVGDLYIEGVGLSPGYWNDPDSTAAAFLPNPFDDALSETIYKTGDLASVGTDGLIRFLGRADSQIKSRGHRIELGEIEAALDSIEALREGAVVAIESAGFEGMTICCAFVPAVDPDLDPAALSSRLRRIVPRYMIPTRWVSLKALPRNANGKIDRNRLREEFRNHGTESG